MGKYKHSYKWFSAWNYEAEIEYLNHMSAEGWQLVKGDGALLAAFFAVLILGNAASIALTELRPNMRSDMRADYMEILPSEPIDWSGFEIKYRDNYFLDLDITADAPLIVTLLDEDDRAIYTATESDVHLKNIKLRLERGFYKLLLSDYPGGRLDVQFHLD